MRNSAWALWLAAGLMLAGCAKFPASGANTQYTRVTIRFSVQGKINTSLDSDPGTQYVYVVGIRATAEDNPDPDRTNPLPIFSPNPNGMMAGQPSHFVIFDTANPESTYPYTLFKFAQTGDPADPVDLGNFSPVPGQIINFTRPGASGTTLQFDLFTNQLADSEAAARALKFLQVNIFTMNRRALGTASGRIIDYLGDGRSPVAVNSAVRVDLRTDGSIFNQNDFEPQGDTSDPDLDLVDWGITVRRP